MSEPWKPPAPGALDDTEWSEQLIARVVARGADDDRLHGYAILGDLARHYRSCDTTYLALVGELPDEAAATLFHFACHACTATSVAEPPAHIAVLARLSGAGLGASLAAGLVAASDQADHLVRTHAALFAWLDAPSSTVPAEFFDEMPCPWTMELIRTIETVGTVPSALHPKMSREAATITLFHAAGLRSPEQIVAAIVTSRCAVIAAEALATGPHHLSLYPVKVPEFRYVDP